jgi:hypothetical protein
LGHPYSSYNATPQLNYGAQFKTTTKSLLNELLPDKLENSPKGSFTAKLPHSVTFQRHNAFILAVTRLTHLGKWGREKRREMSNSDIRGQFSRKLPPIEGTFMAKKLYV